MVRTEIADGIATLTIDRPEVKNALDLDSVGQIRTALREIESNASVGVLIITGSGETAFVSGADINSIRERGRDEGLAAINSSLFSEIERFPRPTLSDSQGRGPEG